MRYGDNLWLAEAKESEAAARSIREELNLPNLLENIAPTRERATMIFTKGSDHRVESLRLRR